MPRERGGGEILIKRMLYLKIIESIGCQERGGGKILIKRMFYLLIIESIGCQERGGGGNFDKTNVVFENH